jgi:hypothetical protein
MNYQVIHSGLKLALTQENGQLFSITSCLLQARQKTGSAGQHPRRVSR